MENTFLTTLQQTINSLGSMLLSLSIHIWGIVIKQNILLGLQRFLYGVLMLTGAILLYKEAKSIYKSRLAILDKRALIIISAVTICVLIFFGVSFAIDALPQLLNPEYYSMKEAVQILQTIKK